MKENILRKWTIKNGRVILISDKLDFKSKLIRWECIKNHIDYDQVGLIPEVQGWFNIHKSMNVIHHIINLNLHWQNPSPLHDKSPGDTASQVTDLNVIKTVYSKGTVYSIIDGEIFKYFH